MQLSIVIPVYNEASTLSRLVEVVRASETGLHREILVVDDGSTDGTRDLLRAIGDRYDDVKVFTHDRNKGKGAALRTGFAHASGDIVLVQDADLEYDPKEYPNLLAPILAGHADVVFGSRFSGGGPHRVLYYWHFVGNKFLTMLSNMSTNLNLTDMEVCYKLFKSEVLEHLTIREDRFGFEPEITAKVARGGWRIYEVPISYYGRSYEEGKKITWRDGMRAIWCILKYRFTS